MYIILAVLFFCKCVLADSVCPLDISHTCLYFSQAKTCKWQYYCGGGAVFSSPCVHLSPRQLYCSTLGGNLHCLNPVSECSFFTWVHAQKYWVLKFESVLANFWYKRSWEWSRGQSSCLKANICLVILHLFSVQDSGKVLWTYSGTVPFFSSPHCSDSSVFIGSVNGHIIGISHSGDMVRGKWKSCPKKGKTEYMWL